MAFSKIIFNGVTQIDLTADTVATDNLLQSYTAHGADGLPIVGTASGGSNLQAKTNISPNTSSQTITADSGYDGLSSVQIDGMPLMVLPTSTSTTSQGTQQATIEPSTSNRLLNIPVGYNDAIRYYVISQMPSGTAGTPSATKGTVSNHSVSVTPSVTNTTGYITGGTKTGTAVTVSASELVSGSETKTENGTYDVTNLAELVVNVSSSGSSKNVQVAQSTNRATTSTYTSVVSLTCSTAGTYDIYWDCFRSSTGGTNGSQLYIGGSAYGTANTTFTNHAQTNHLTGVTLTRNQTVAVYARSRGSNYYAYVGTLAIVQTA